MSCSRFRGSFRRQRSSSVRMDAGVSARQRSPIGLVLQNADERVRHRVAVKWRGGPPASRKARTRTPRCRCACRPPGRAPARGSCRPAFRECARPPCRRASPTAAASDHRPRIRAIVFARPKSSTFARTSLDGTPAAFAAFAARCWPASDRDGRSLSRAPRRAPRRSDARSRAPRRSAAARAPGDRRASALRPARGPAPSRRRFPPVRRSRRCADD